MMPCRPNCGALGPIWSGATRFGRLGCSAPMARGGQREDSDLDVLVELGEGIGLIGVVGLQLDLSDALGVKVDLVDRLALKPAVSRRVQAEVVML